MKKILFSILMVSVLLLSTWVHADNINGYVEIDGTKYYFSGTVEGTEVTGVTHATNYNRQYLEITITDCDINYINITDLKGVTITVVGDCNVGYIKSYNTNLELKGDGTLTLNDTTVENYINLSQAADKEDSNTCTVEVNLVFEDAGKDGVYVKSDGVNLEITSPNIELSDGDMFISSNAKNVNITDSKISFANIDTLITSTNVNLENVDIDGESIGTFINATGDIILSRIEIDYSDLKQAMFVAGGTVSATTSELRFAGEITSGSLIEAGKDIVITDSLLDIDVATSDVTTTNALSAKGSVVLEESSLFVGGNTANAINCKSLVTSRTSMTLTAVVNGVYATGAVELDNSEVKITIQEDNAVGINCSTFAITDGQLMIKDVAKGILATGTVAFNSGAVMLETKEIALEVHTTKKENNIKIGNGMMVVPYAEVYVGKYSNNKGYVATFAYATPTYNVKTKKVTNAAKFVTISSDPVEYKLIAGANQTYTKNKDGAISFTIEKADSEFRYIYINGVPLPTTEYTAKKEADGTIKVEISKAYMNKLSNGTYYVSFLFDMGMAKTKVTVKNASKDVTPATGIKSYVEIATVISIMSLAGILLITKKQEN